MAGVKNNTDNDHVMYLVEYTNRTRKTGVRKSTFSLMKTTDPTFRKSKVNIDTLCDRCSSSKLQDFLPTLIPDLLSSCDLCCETAKEVRMPDRVIGALASTALSFHAYFVPPRHRRQCTKDVTDGERWSRTGWSLSRRTSTCILKRCNYEDE